MKRALEALDRECERAAVDEERANLELARSARGPLGVTPDLPGPLEGD